MGRRRTPAAVSSDEEATHASSGEESSGEESSGDEEGGQQPTSEASAAKRDREARPTGAQQREAHRLAVQEAREANRQGKAARNKAASKQAKESELDKKRRAKIRVAHLLEKADVFRQFLDPSIVADPAQTSREKNQSRRRLTEREGDEAFMQHLQSREVIPRLTAKETAGLIRHGEMRAYQVDGLNWLIRSHHRGLNGILADEMGLGKTLQSISLLAYLHKYEKSAGPHMVVVPKSTLGNWMKEFAQWYPQLRVVNLYGNKQERALICERDLLFGKFDVVLVSYEMAIKEKAALNKFSWEYLVVDEAHRLKNENSLLSQIVRMYNSKCRLLVTGTPLQNNLHELWALLNFLLPDVFGDSAEFEAFTSVAEAGSSDLVATLHAVLRPFILRRLKVDVERGMPPKTELTVYCPIAPLQRKTYKDVLKNNGDVLNGATGGRTKLLNIVMQLRKAANHPYLFDGVEDKSLDPFGEHVVEESGKLRILDKLLPRLHGQGSRVLIFSQMTRMLDILDDYCEMRRLSRCRIDGQTSCEDRDRQIEEFNSKGSPHSVFLLSTRAGGLGINLATADIVVLYDSDWNPQMDLQAQDRAHRIGQTKPVKVFRLVSEHTIEERILERALQKLKLDAVVIQKGGLVEQDKGSNKDELLAAIRCGADAMFRAKSGELADEDIDTILERAEKRTKEMEAEMEAAAKSGPSANALDSRAWKFGGDSEDEGVAGDDMFIDLGKRERKIAAKPNIAPAPAKQQPEPVFSAEASLMQRPAQTAPPYKDLVVLALGDANAAGDNSMNAQKMIATVKRKFPTLDFKKKLWAAALAKAIKSGTVKENNMGPKWGGKKLFLTKEGKIELERANETEARRRSREEVDESRPPLDSHDTPFPGWTMRTYYMSDGGEVKHYLPPPMKLPAIADSVAAADEPAQATKSSEGSEGSDGEEDDGFEVERIVGRRTNDGEEDPAKKGLTEYKVRWKGYSPEDDTWESEESLGSAMALVREFEEKRRLKAAMQPPPVITSMQKLLGFIKTRPEVLAVADNDQNGFLRGFGWVVSTPRARGTGAQSINWNNTDIPDPERSKAQFEATEAQAKASTSIKAVAKLMLASHVSGGFWLQLPTELGEVLPDVQGGVKAILQEKESMDEWEVVWLRKGKKGGGLSGGWRGFSIDMELCAGDAVLFEYLGCDPADGTGGQEEQGPARLLATINRAIPLEENPNRVVDKPPPKGPSVVASSAATGASSADGKPKMRRTTQIVKRENKLRNAILAGDENFSYAAARSAAAAGGQGKAATSAATSKPQNELKGKRANQSGAAAEAAVPATKKAKGAVKQPKTKTTTTADAKSEERDSGNANTKQGNSNGKTKKRGVAAAAAARAAKKSKPDKGPPLERSPKVGDQVDVDFVSMQ